jgi:cytochrome c biogenesis protein CcdA
MLATIVAAEPLAVQSRVMRIDPLLEETLAATGAVALLGVVLTVLFWALTGESPWPGVILGEIVGLGMGIPLLALTAPRRRR